MNHCLKCRGLVPEGQSKCPNCAASPAWWKRPLAIAGAGFATVTLSACYGAPCASTVNLPDGGVGFDDEYTCGVYDCNDVADAGGTNDPKYIRLCTTQSTDAGTDAGVDTDAGTDAGP